MTIEVSIRVDGDDVNDLTLKRLIAALVEPACNLSPECSTVKLDLDPWGHERP